MRPQTRSYVEDERRETSFVAAMLVFWALAGLFLVIRDPLWRLFYEGRLVGRSSQAPGWTAFDEKLMNQLSSGKVTSRPGLDGLEHEFEQAIHQRVANEGASRNPSSPSQPGPFGVLRGNTTDLEKLIQRTQQATIKESHGQPDGTCLPAACFTVEDYADFKTNKSATRTAEELQNSREFVDAIALIRKLNRPDREGRLASMRKPLRRTWAECGKITPECQTESGNSAEKDIANAIVDAAAQLSLESDSAFAIRQQAAREGTSQNPTLGPQWAITSQLRDIARAHAAAEDRAAGSGGTVPVDMQYPELTVALARPNQLVRVMNVGQPLTASPAAGSTVPAELVGGWMNLIGFANIVQNPANVDFGVGIVQSDHRPGVQVGVLLVQTFLQLDTPLPAVTSKDTPINLSGRRLSADDVALYFKGPKDPSFSPLAAQWNGDHFKAAISWGQGAGVYALRARRADRLSDPRPIIVK